MPLILGIESTCDETAAAVVRDGFDVRSNIVATQIDLHAKYRGVVPEIASRAHVENILPVIREAMSFSLPRLRGRAGVGASNSDSLTTKSPLPNPPPQAGEGIMHALDQLDAIAVAHRPGLIGSLLIGVTAAKTLAWALGKPLVGVDHVHAHLYSVKLETNLQPQMPAVGLVCSGGHTALYALNSFTDVRLIGTTIDDAVGEAYDKVAAILGLGYPGGPILDKLAESGDPKAIHFPRSTLGRESLDFSFSGLKTAVLYHVRGFKGKKRGPEALSPQQLADVAASFQAACIDVMTIKLRRACDTIDAKSVIIGGGVSANRGLRTAMEEFPLPVHFPPMRYCTDNAAMSAGLANLHLASGRISDLSLDAITSSQFLDAL